MKKISELTEAELVMASLIGCSSHSCVVKPPVGMGTNGPCRCADYKGQRLILVLRNRITELEAENARLREENAELKHECSTW